MIPNICGVSSKLCAVYNSVYNDMSEMKMPENSVEKNGKDSKFDDMNNKSKNKRL